MVSPPTPVSQTSTSASTPPTSRYVAPEGMPVLQPVKREKPVPSTQVQKKAKAEGIVKNTVIPNGTPLIPVKKAKTEALPGESAKVLAAVKSQAIHLDGRLPATPQTGLFMNPVPLPKAPMHPPAKSPSQMTSPSPNAPYHQSSVHSIPKGSVASTSSTCSS